MDDQPRTLKPIRTYTDDNGNEVRVYPPRHAVGGESQPNIGRRRSWISFLLDLIE